MTNRQPRGARISCALVVRCRAVEHDDLHIPGSGAVQQSPAQQDSPDSGRSAPTRTPSKRGPKHLSEEQFESACLLIARGLATEQVAEILWVPEKRVARALRKPTAQARIAYLRGRHVLQEIEHDAKLRDMLPGARNAIYDAIANGSIPQKQRSAHWLHEAIIAKPATRTESRVEVEARVRHDLAPVFGQIKDLLKGVREANADRASWRDRVKLGGDALKRPQLASGE